MFAGQMACEGLNWGLKRWIKEERPRQMNGKGYGMPSSHAQFVAYFSVSLTLFLLLRHQPTPSTTHTPITFLTRVVVSILALISAATVTASRVYLNYHTAKQVLVGSAAGVICAVSWFGVCTLLRAVGALDAFLDLSVARVFRLRDLATTEDLVESGWLRWEALRSRRSRSSVNGTTKKIR
ncbi:MAG: hypothetical protein M1817_004586 [Caeruleum heppii]|nr:MAG: hypothetical protein M1817_004586 [Caeruleum heppii]